MLPFTLTKEGRNPARRRPHCLGSRSHRAPYFSSCPLYWPAKILGHLYHNPHFRQLSLRTAPAMVSTVESRGQP